MANHRNQPGLKRSRPRSSWEANDEVVSSVDITLADIMTIVGDPWVDDMREVAGLPRTVPAAPPRERVLPDSTVENPTKAVWRICSANRGLDRKAQIALCVEQGINVHTARTQQSKWAIANKGL